MSTYNAATYHMGEKMTGHTVTETKIEKIKKGVYRVSGTSVSVEKDIDGRNWVFSVSGELMPFAYKTLSLAAEEGRKTYNRIVSSGGDI